MRHLCDSNVFLALTVEAHPHHIAAVEWLSGLSDDDKACLCRATQTSYLRLLTVQSVMREHVRSNQDALGLYRRLRSDSRIGYLPEPDDLEEHWFRYASHRQPSPNLWMDAYLAAFARAAGVPLVTFDRGIGRFDGVDVLVLRESRRH